jgi:maleate isomerase
MSDAVLMKRPVVSDDKHKYKNIGLLSLSTDPVVERDFRTYFPLDKFNIYVNRVEFNPPVTNENLMAMGSRITKAASLVAPDEPLDVIAYCCTSCATNLGDNVVCENINLGRPGVPAINPALAGQKALKSIGAKKIGLVTPYIEEVSDSVASYFESFDIAVEKHVCMRCESDYEISRVSDQTMIDAAIEVSKDVDAIFMSCAAFPATRVIKQVEEATGIPVVTSNQAMIWMAYRLMGTNDKIDLGKLFDYDLL